VDHNREDVLMLEKVYMHLRPLVQNHPNVNLLSGRLMACPVCGSRNLQKRGWRLSKTRRSRKYVCGDCTSWSTGPSQPVDGVEIR
jgi:predicted SprT family Zn-dependent metalloprotease